MAGNVVDDLACALVHHHMVVYVHATCRTRNAHVYVIKVKHPFKGQKLNL